MKKNILLLALCFLFACTVMAQAPVNDNCSGAIAISCGATITANSTNATNEVLPSVSCGSFASGINRGVWYKYAATTNGVVALRTCGTSWDTYLRVYTGTCGALNSCVVYNDDACNRASELTFTAVSGTTYYILLAGYYPESYGQFSLQLECAASCIAPTIQTIYVNSATDADVLFTPVGNYVIEYGLAGFTPGTGATTGGGVAVIATSISTNNISGLLPATSYDVYIRKQCTSNPSAFSSNSAAGSFTTFNSVPVNDECSTALQISATPLAATIMGATESTAAVFCGQSQSPVAHDVWFKFTAPNNQFTRIWVKNAINFNPVIQLYGGSCSSQTEISCADFYGYGANESLGFTPEAGQTYYVRVYGNDNFDGDFNIFLCLGQLSLTSSAAGFCDASQITLTAGSGTGTYQWYKNDVLIPNATTQSINITQPGFYYVKLPGSGNCELISGTIEILPALIAPSLGGTGVYNDYEFVNVGIPLTELTQNYTWRKAGGVVYGPLNGNGSNQSLQFNMSAGSQGTYVVESRMPGCTSSTYSNQVFVYYGGITDLQLDNCPFNYVDFRWRNYNNPVARYQYAVTTSEDPPASGTETFNSYASVTNLLPATNYYLHVRGASFSSLFINSYSYNNSIWVTLPFTTQATAVAGSCEWTGNTNTDWFEPGNWRCNMVPGIYSGVVIPSGRPRYPLINTNTTVKSLQVRTGATVNLQAGKILTVTN